MKHGCPQTTEVAVPRRNARHRRFLLLAGSFAQPHVLECCGLADNGLVSGDPPTFRTFVSDYNRSGQKEIWEPTIGASTLERDGIMMGGTDVCPRGPNVW